MCIRDRIWGERRLGQEDLGHPHSHRADRSATVATWPGEPGDGGGADVVEGANPPAAGSDPDGIAGTTASVPGRAFEHRADVAGLAADGTAAKKKSLHAQEQDTPEAQQRRQAWRQTLERFSYLCSLGPPAEAGSEVKDQRERGAE